MAPNKRGGCVAVSLVAGLPAAFLVGVLATTIPRPTAIPASVAESVFEQECAEAARLGLSLATRSPAPVALDASPAPVELTLAAGECVAIVAAAWDFQKVESVGVYEAGSSADPVALSTHRLDAELVGHAQWCTDAPAAVKLLVTLRGLDSYGRDGSTQGHLRMAVYRGAGASFGGLRGLTRGALSERAYRRVSVSTLLAEAARNVPQGARPIGPELVIAPDAARLVPENAATYRVLYDAALNGTSSSVSPRVSPLPLDVPAPWRPTASPGVLTSITGLRARLARDSDPGPQFPLLVANGVAFRTLAVVSPAYLGAACVDLRFVRMLYGHRAQVSRVTADRNTATLLPQVDNEARDRACAAQGTVAYVAPSDDHESYRLRIYAAP